ncbi:IS4 family transposase, partial [Cupriavidus sp. SK-4]
MRLRRACPELEAQLLFERDEWQAVFILSRKGSRPRRRQAS